MRTKEAAQKREKANLQNLRQDREQALTSLLKQPKMSSAEAIANYNLRQERAQPTREAVWLASKRQAKAPI